VSALGMLGAAALGLGLGVVTSMSPAVINVSIVDAAAAGRRRFATGLGLGGAVADTIHAGLAFAGVGGVVIADPRRVRGLALVAAAAIVAYAAWAWRRRRAPVPDRPGGRGGSAGGPPPTDRLGRGAATGFALTLLNPAALAAWVAVAASARPGAVPLEAAVIAGGVGAGSALWFTLFARWISGVRAGHPALATVPRVSLLLLIAIALIGVVRAL
jgi:threonine/homoserine/homoserine lactone efflux protein